MKNLARALVALAFVSFGMDVRAADPQRTSDAPRREGPRGGSAPAGVAVSTSDFPGATAAAAASATSSARPDCGGLHVPLNADAHCTAGAGTGTASGAVCVTDPNAAGGGLTADAPATLVANFIGIPDVGAFIPPDPHMAAGPNHVMAVVNSEFAIFDKSGTSLFRVDADSWFDSVQLNAGPFDPQIVYDHGAQRWVMTWVGGNTTTTAHCLISVSDDADPMGTWFSWSLPGNLDGTTVTNNFNDYPKIGIDENAVYITSNQFNMTSRAFAYVKIRIVPKAQLYTNTGAAITYTDIWDLRDPGSPATKAFTVVPAVDFGDAGAGDGIAYLVSDSPFVTGTHMTLWKLTNPLGTPVLTAVNVPVATSTAPPNAAQLGGGALIDAGGRRVRNAVYRDGSLWTCHSVARSGGGADARYVRIGVTSQTALEDVSFGAPGTFHLYPAIQLDAGLNVVMGYTRTTSAIWAETAFTGRRATDPPGLSPSTQLKPGEGNYVKTFGGTRNRWGDYSGIALDPATGAVWMLLEYASTSNRWGTWFSAVSYGSGGVGPTITSTPATTATAGAAYAYDGDGRVAASGTAPITFSLVSGPAGMSVASDGLVTWTPTGAQTGLQHVVVGAANTFGSTTQAFDVTVAAGAATAVRVNVGGPNFTDGGGNLFVADRAFTPGGFGYLTGQVSTFANAIAGTTDDPLYQDMRYATQGSGAGVLRYAFDALPSGTYQVTLHFTEPYLNAGGRVMDVFAEGVLAINDLDVAAVSGGKFRALTQTFSTTVGDGRLDLDIAMVTANQAIVSAIAVVGTGPPPAAPEVTVAPASLAFGQVTTGSSGDLTVDVRNDGNANLVVTALGTSPAAYTLVGAPALPLTILPGAAPVTLTVRFSPLAAGSHPGTLGITSNDADEGVVQVALSGTGVAPPAPDIVLSATTLDFGHVATGSTADLTVNVSNVGSSNLTVSALATTHAAYTIVGAPALPFVVAPGGASVPVTVRFGPTATGTLAGTLDVTSDDPDEGLLAVTLTGVGDAPAPVAIRVNCGGPDFATGDGRLFLADRAFAAGSFGYLTGGVSTFTNAIALTTDDGLYQRMRIATQSNGNYVLRYAFDALPPATYLVTLEFTEPYQSAGGRVMDVSAEGVLKIDDLDVFSAAGGKFRALTRSFTATVTDGRLDLDVAAVTANQAILSGIEVVQQ